MSTQTIDKKTVVLGATPNPARYANLATKRLKANGVETVPVGIRKGEIEGLTIQPIEMENGMPSIEGVHTITLYLGPERQKPHYEYILSLEPKRIIFNPGTENAELMQLARQNGIEVEANCTLVMLSIGDY